MHRVCRGSTLFDVDRRAVDPVSLLGVMNVACNESKALLLWSKIKLHGGDDCTTKCPFRDISISKIL